MKKRIGIALFASLLGVILFWPSHPLQAQGTPGFTKIGSTANANFTTPALTDGATYEFEVTGTNVNGESGPSNIVTVTIPATGTHTVFVNWVLSPYDTGYNVYDFLVPAPAVPTGVTATVN